MRLILVFILIVSLGGCFETGGGAAGPETDAVIDTEIGAEIDEGIDIDVESPGFADTPPIMGPSDDPRTALGPIPSCPEGVDIEDCDTRNISSLNIERDTLCQYVEGMPREWSETVIKTKAQFSDQATVDLSIHTRGAKKGDSFEAMGVRVAPLDVSESLPYYQLPVAEDGSVTLIVKTFIIAHYDITLYGEFEGERTWASGGLDVVEPCLYFEEGTLRMRRVEGEDEEEESTPIYYFDMPAPQKRVLRWLGE